MYMCVFVCECMRGRGLRRLTDGELVVLSQHEIGGGKITMGHLLVFVQVPKCQCQLNWEEYSTTSEKSLHEMYLCEYPPDPVFIKPFSLF